MKTFILNIVVFLAFIIPPGLNAQSYFDAVNIGYEHGQYSPNEASEFSFNRFRAKLNYGLELKNDDYLIATYSGDIFKFQDIEFTGKELDIYSNILGLGYLHYWKEKQWSLLAQMRFKLNSDFHGISLGDIQTGGLFLFTNDKNEKLSLFAGMYFNKEVNKFLIFPLGGIHWIPNEKWNLYVLIPSEIRFEWILKPNSWYAGFESDWTLNSYLINKEESINYFRKETLLTSVFIEKHLSEKIVLFGKIGNYQINDYEAYDETDQLIHQPQLDSGLIKNISLQAGIAYRIRN